ncbi:hypothetical protein MTO96_049643 [Rhipicephalus appendiculatus]
MRSMQLTQERAREGHTGKELKESAESRSAHFVRTFMNFSYRFDMNAVGFEFGRHAPRSPAVIHKMHPAWVPVETLTLAIREWTSLANNPPGARRRFPFHTPQCYHSSSPFTLSQPRLPGLRDLMISRSTYAGSKR